ncbi:MAG: copper resistance protein CopC [Sphingomonadales bacterium]|nr:copper resistance protein CopC [Sphingomonadales bacterium]
MIRFLFPAAIVAIATPASAHLKLTASTPAANAKVAKPGRIILTFSDKMVASSFKAELVMITMPGMADHPPMKMSGYTTQMSGDGKSVNLLLKRALPPGGYLLKWSAAGTDTHPVSGEVPFTVR